MSITKSNELTVAIAKMHTSANCEDIIVTHSLGSCLGITAYDPEKKIGGMVHCLLPLSNADPDKAKEEPCMFVDTGVTSLLKQLISMGADRSKLIIKVAGGAQLMDANKVFNIGNRNFTAFRKIMWKNKLLIAAQDVGGFQPRTMRLYLADGKVTILSEGIKEL